MNDNRLNESTESSLMEKILYYDDNRKSCFYNKIFGWKKTSSIFHSVAIEDCDMRSRR